MSDRSQAYVDPASHYSSGALHRLGLPSGEQVRLEVISAEIPDGVERILDCGCGTGYLGNLLRTRYTVVGCDVASPALEHCEFETVPASLTDLPFEDRSFDLVLSSEVLEHILPGEYEQACRELERVADRWLLVTVPYKEDLDCARRRCPHCGTIFHDAWHVRSVDEQALAESFRDFRVHHFFRMGHKQRLDAIWRQRFMNRLFGYRPVVPDRQCPMCGQFGTESGERDAQLIATRGHAAAQIALSHPGVYGALRRAALRLVPGRPRWLGALLERA